MKKQLGRILTIFIIAVLVIPIGPVQRKDDGGTVEYISLTWRLDNRKIIHSENGVEGHILGKRFYLLGICLYDDTFFTPNAQTSHELEISPGMPD